MAPEPWCPPGSESEWLRLGATALGVELDEQQIDGLRRYLGLLHTWNLRTNLVATKDRGALLERHILDSLAPVRLLRERGHAPAVVDVGSGGGLPGVPIAIACPGARLTLLEPRRKKASFLRAAARECFTWNIAVEERRADELGRIQPQGFDVAVSRAAFPPAELPAQAGPLLRPGGLLIGFTTDQTPATAHAYAGFAAPQTVPYDLRGHPGAFSLTTWERRPD